MWSGRVEAAPRVPALHAGHQAPAGAAPHFPFEFTNTRQILSYQLIGEGQPLFPARKPRELTRAVAVCSANN